MKQPPRAPEFAEGATRGRELRGAAPGGKELRGAAPGGKEPQADLHRAIEAAIEKAHHVLPDQGPIGVFVHHNTLHAFQHLPFFDAIEQGAAQLGTQPYWPLYRLRETYACGRITAASLQQALTRTLGARAEATVLWHTTHRQLWELLCTQPIREVEPEALAFAIAHRTHVAATELPLWQTIQQRVERWPTPTVTSQPPLRHRDLLLQAKLGDGASLDVDLVVNAELIRLCAAYLDQGQSHTRMPGREHGFLHAVAALHRGGAQSAPMLHGAATMLVHALNNETSAEEVIADALQRLGVPVEHTEAYLLETLLALRGFAGMFSRLERHPDENHADTAPRLVDFLAVRLAYECHAIINAGTRLGCNVDWTALRNHCATDNTTDGVALALTLFFLARAAAKTPADVAALTDAQLQALNDALDGASDIAVRRTLFVAYEASYAAEILDAIAKRSTTLAQGLSQIRANQGGHRGAADFAPALQVASSSNAQQSMSQPHQHDAAAQFIFCIDEREESIRRALEEQSPHFETFGAAGFFGLAIDYLGLDDHHAAPHAPIVVTPGHRVHETPIFLDRKRHLQRQRVRLSLNRAEHQLARASRTLAGGLSASLAIGPLALVTALLRVFWPRTSLRWHERMLRSLVMAPRTRLTGIRDDNVLADAPIQKPLGFSVDEAADRVTALLRNIGMAHGGKELAPVVVVLGHGSSSLNNPHESAHDCGACGGRRGGANARTFAELANRSDVRAAVQQRGIEIPASTWFVGALHDTASDAVTYYDLETLPRHIHHHFDAAARALDVARARSAQERCRRFETVPLQLDAAQALVHVEERAAHLAQPRPEYGHCTNAVCIVGRRERTRGLFLDRRAFLVSYDPTTDHDDVVLERVLAAVGPVGAGINLEYYFSSVDNEGFGCGTKLPHNVTGHLGIMNGHQSDLRTGLPWQMVELHEPMRLLLIVDATPDALLRVAGRQPEVMELVKNAWVQLVSHHPTTNQLAQLDTTTLQFVPFVPTTTPLPVVATSPDYFQRSRVHLPPVLVQAGLALGDNA